MQPYFPGCVFKPHLIHFQDFKISRISISSGSGCDIVSAMSNPDIFLGYIWTLLFSFSSSIYFPAQLVGGFTLSDLLDKPWSHVGVVHASLPVRAFIFISHSRSPRWTSGSPRMLLVLVREFESRRGEVLIYLQQQKKRKEDQLLRAPSVSKHNSTRVDEGKKSWNRLAIKNARHEPHWGGGKSLLRDPGSELRLGGRDNRRARITNGMENK